MAEPDVVEELFAAWRRERPDLDVDTMVTVGRVLRFARLADETIGENARKHGVSIAEGDVLFSLRRAGPPYVVSPSELSAALLVPSGTLTGRLDRLEGAGLIERMPDPDDRRGMKVRLTDKGLAGTDAAVTAHLAVERELIAPLSARDREQLDRIMRKLLAGQAPG
jgi:DNA-binding MarR family transcriptional regulator